MPHAKPTLRMRPDNRRGGSVKTGVLEAIGEIELRRPAQVNDALAANDRVKYLMSLLQMAITQADQPDQRAEPLRRERLAAGVDDTSLDEVVGSARREGDRYRIPDAPRLFAMLADALQVMAAPLAAQERFSRRLDTLLAAIPDGRDDLVDGAVIADMTRAGRAGADSLHQFVMDLHKALNALQADLAEERLNGAAVYALTDEDRPRVTAFMEGLNRTAPLKFDHPGLATTATRAGQRLVIQNDIGTTDAHVIVVHVEGLVVEVTYSDIHPQRARFMRDMLERFPVSWGKEQSRHETGLEAGEAFVLSTGRLEAKDEAELRAYLDFLGSRLVFLIDWNRARKQLRGCVRESDRVGLLRWAADNEIGHRGFLELGGASLINEAIEATAGSAMHFGDRLCDVLGEAPAAEFLRFVLRAASEGLRARQSHALIRDRVHADLAAHFSNEARRLLQIAGDHAGLIFEIASLVRDGVHATTTTPAANAALARRARGFEHDADEMVSTVRAVVHRRNDHAPLLRLVEVADDAADHLEESASLLELLARSEPSGAPLDALAALADLLVDAAQEWVKILAHATELDHGDSRLAGSQEDVDDFLTATDRVATLEHSGR